MASIGTPKYITVQQAESYASQAGFNNQLVPKSKYSPGTYTQIQTIVGIAVAESGLNVNAYNPNDPYGGSYGVLQINGAHFHTGGTSEQAALDPLKAFQYAYGLSSHGTNFIPWGTFTNGSYLNNIPSAPQQSTLPQQGWWNFYHDNDYGTYPDPQGPYNKPDVNVRAPYGYPIAMPVSGIVSGINSPDGHSIPSWGAVVTIKLDVPINNLATHVAFLHLADVTARLGQRVQPGDIVAHAGDSNHAAGSMPALLGVALTSGDYYGFDGWNYNAAADPRLNPSPWIDSLATGNPFMGNPSSYSTNTFTSGNFISQLTTFTQANINLSPDASVVAVFEAMDIATTIINPLSVITSDQNPLDWIPEIVLYLMSDFAALSIRAFILFIGIYMCFKVINRMINFTGTVEKGVQLAGNVAKIATIAG